MSVARPLTWFNVIGYGAGDMANNLVFAMGSLFLLHYYTDVAGIPAATAGTLLAAVRIYDAVMDVAAGRVVDRTATRWGRFRPFLLGGALPLLLLSVAVFSVPSGWSAGAKLAYAYVTYTLLGTAYSFVNIPYGSLATVMTQDPRERARLGASRTFMAVCTASFLTMVVGPTVAGFEGQALQAWLTRLTLGLAIAGAMLYAFCFAATREIVERQIERPRLDDSLGTLIGNTPLLMLCAAALCVLTGLASSTASLVYFARYMLGDVTLFFFVIGLTSLLSVSISAAVVPILAGRIGKKRTFLLGLAIATLGYGALFLASGAGKAWVFGSFAVAALGAGTSMSIMWAIEADTVEYGQWRTGVRIEGLTYALFSLTRKCGQSLGGSIPAFLLAAGGYVPNAPVQDETARQAILQAVALVPVLAFAAAFTIMACYPLTDRRFAELLAEIKDRTAGAG